MTAPRDQAAEATPWAAQYCGSWGVLALLALLFGANPLCGQQLIDAQPASADTDDSEILAEGDRLWNEAKELHSAGQFAAAAAVGERLLALDRQRLGEESGALVVALEWLAATYLKAEDFPAAEQKRSEALAGREKSQGAHHWQTIDARLALDDVRLRRQLTDAQRQRLREADASLKESVGLADRGSYAEALPLAQRAEGVRREILGAKHRDYVTSIGWVAKLYNAMGDYARAEPLYRRALESRKEVLGEKHPVYAASLNNLAGLYYRQGDYVRAEPLYRQALEIDKKILGEKHPHYAVSLNNLAALYNIRCDYARAEPLFRQALEITREVRGEKHPDYATSLNNLAGVYKNQGDYARAEPLIRQAAEINKEALGEKHPVYATSLNNLAELYTSLGDYARAEPLYRQALEINKEALGEKHPVYATGLNNLAGLYTSMGDYARAEPLFRQALEIRKEALGEKHPDYATSLNNLAGLYDSMGDYVRAEPLFRQAAEINKEVLGEKHPDYATSLNNLAGLYDSQGDYARAEPRYRQALEITKEALGEKHPAYATSLNNLATLYINMGDYARAEPLYRQALEIKKVALGKEHPEYAGSLSNLAGLYHSMGDYARAEPLIRQALEIKKEALGEKHPDYAGSLNNLAGLYESQGDYARAEPLYRQASENWKVTLGEKHPDYATSLNNLAGLYYRQGDYVRAEPLYHQALEIRKVALGKEHRDYAGSLNNLAALYKSMGDYARAEPLNRQALRISKEALGEKHPDYATSLNNLAELYDRMGDYARAEPLLRQALQITSEHLEATAAVLTEQQQLLLGRSVQHRLDSYLSCLLRINGRDEAAFRAALSWKGATLVRQRAARLAAESPELAPLFAELQSTVRQWATLIQVPPQEGAAWKERLASLTVQKERLEAELSSKSAAYRTLTNRVELEDVLAALPPEAALVDYLEFWYFQPSKEKPGQHDWRQSLLAFVVRPGHEVQMFDLGPVGPVSEGIDRWRESLGMSPEAKLAGDLLREKLWQPLAAAIGDAQTVLVSPDGALGRLPFGALPGKESDTYLLEEVRLALVPVPQLIPALVSDAGRPNLPKDLLVVGGVDYDRRTIAEPRAASSFVPAWERRTSDAVALRSVAGGERWDFLDGSGSEASFIKGRYLEARRLPANSDRVVELRGAAATEEQFRAMAPQCAILHLSTHGFFAEEDKASAAAAPDREPQADRGNLLGDRREAVRGYSPGLLSGLVLAGANDPPQIPEDISQLDELPDDGYLTADEIAFLPLNGAQLVVLSACDSGLGETAGGEGLLGVQRAFQVSGARTAIATLWKVNDEATRRFMEEFYINYLEKRMSPLDALRAAQLWALDNPNLVPRGADPPADQAAAKRLPPEFWAAFTLSGDWR